MIRQPFETYDEKALAEVWRMEVESSRRRIDADDDAPIKLRDNRCHSDVALNRVLDENLRAIMAVFWYKGRQTFVELLDSEIAARCRITEHELKPQLDKLISLGAVTWRRDRGSRFVSRQCILVRRLTKIGMSVATVDREAREIKNDAMLPMQLMSIRKQMGINTRHMAARLNIEIEDLLAMEAGKKQITTEMAKSVHIELKKHIERTSKIQQEYGE